MAETIIETIMKDQKESFPTENEILKGEQPTEESKPASKSAKSLPNNVWTNILQQYALGESTIPNILLLRRVSPWFNDEVLSILFVRQMIDFTWPWRNKRVPVEIMVCFIQGFFAQRKLPLKFHKQMRRAMLRAVGLDPRIPDVSEGTCLTSKPKQPCLRQIVGPSSGVTCVMHDMMEAIAFALATNVFYLGGEQTVVIPGFPTTENGTESRYWKLLTVVSQVSKNVKNEKAVSDLTSLLQEISADRMISDVDRSSMISDCFVLAARRNNPELIEVLYQVADDEADLASILNKRTQTQNALWESIRLGNLEALEKFMSKKWEFDLDVNPYSTCLTGIIYQKSLPAATRAKMLRSMLDWSKDWRKANMMEMLLVAIGSSCESVLLEEIVSALKADYHFNHPIEEETNPYHGPPSQPLWSLSHHENTVEMVKCFIDNRKLILPHMKDETWKEMRTQTLQLLFRDRTGKTQENSAKTEVLKLIIEHSQDLIEDKHSLQNIIILNFDELPPEKWDWLVEKIGLESKCDTTHEGHTLGSALIGVAVERLNVENVRFLVKSGVGLVKEANTIRVKDDDEAAMKRLETVTELLTQGGQGEYTQKRSIYTTFSASKVEPPKPKKKPAIESNPIMRISNTVVRMAHSPRPRSVKRTSISKRHSTKLGMKSGSVITAVSVSSGSSVTS